jgi:nitroreductase
VKEFIKNILSRILGEGLYERIKTDYTYLQNKKKLKLNFRKDYQNYSEHSTVFKTDNFKKIESELILDYHGLEKGFLHNELRYRFAEHRVKRMIRNLEKINYDSSKSSQVSISLKVLSDYFKLHLDNNVNIEDFFSEKIYTRIQENLIEEEEIYKVVSKSEYYKNVNGNFLDFSGSRKSIRSFSKELIEIDVIKSVVDIAKTAPSVCNRQPAKVHFIQNKKVIDEILDIQGGLTGFRENINQIIVLTSDRNYFFSVGERNQLYIDGGIFLMNLLYSLHYHKIASCCANWGKEYQDDLKAEKILGLKPSEKIICVIALGYVEDTIKYTLSKRRTVDEILTIVN